MEVVKVQKTIYKPVFDPETGLYTDESPFKLHSRNNMIYTCLCNHSQFHTLTTFKSHIKTKSHLKFLMHYELHVEDATDAQSTSNDYQSKYELTERKCKQMIQTISELEKEIAHHKFLNLILRYQCLKMDHFEDCSDTISEDFSDHDSE
jgi:hypothetical protein